MGAILHRPDERLCGGVGIRTGSSAGITGDAAGDVAAGDGIGDGVRDGEAAVGKTGDAACCCVTGVVGAVAAGGGRTSISLNIGLVSGLLAYSSTSSNMPVKSGKG